MECMDVKSRIVCSRIHNPLDICALCVKIRNLEVNFKTDDMIMNIYDFFIRLICLVTKCRRLNKNREDRRFLFIHRIQMFCD